MDDRSLKVLEFYQLLEVLKTFSISPLGRKRCEALRPSTDLALDPIKINRSSGTKRNSGNHGGHPHQGLKGH